jgi:hypothetical protein
MRVPFSGIGDQLAPLRVGHASQTPYQDMKSRSSGRKRRCGGLQKFRYASANQKRCSPGTDEHHHQDEHHQRDAVAEPSRFFLAGSPARWARNSVHLPLFSSIDSDAKPESNGWWSRLSSCSQEGRIIDQRSTGAGR